MDTDQIRVALSSHFCNPVKDSRVQVTRKVYIDYTDIKQLISLIFISFSSQTDYEVLHNFT